MILDQTSHESVINKTANKVLFADHCLKHLCYVSKALKILFKYSWVL